MAETKGSKMAEEIIRTLEATVRGIRHNSRKKNSAEEEVWMVLQGLHGEVRIAVFCRREGIHPNMYYKWSKDFLEASSFPVRSEIVT